MNSPEELQAAIGPRTAMIEILGQHFGSAKLDLKDGRRSRGKPAYHFWSMPQPTTRPFRILILRWARTWSHTAEAILSAVWKLRAVGREDLVRAAWANSAPHHAFGRALKGE